MSNPTRVIELDPFFDRGDAGMPPQQPGLAASQDVGYHAVDRATTRDMRHSSVGLPGTVIPKATLYGIPRGTKPHSTADVFVTIDPHIPGQSSTIRLGDLNPRNIEAAMYAAAATTPEPTDIPTMRLRSAAVMHKLASVTGTQLGEQITPDRQFQPIIPQPIEQPPMPQQQVQQRRVSPLSFFGQPHTPHTPPTPQPQVQFRESLQPVQTSQPPAVHVTFEMEHFGMLPMAYHDVIVEEGFVVLVFDTRHKGSTKYFPPPAKSDAPRMAMSIDGTDEVYLVQTTGIQYVHDNKEFCILLVERTGHMEQG